MYLTPKAHQDTCCETLLMLLPQYLEYVPTVPTSHPHLDNPPRVPVELADHAFYYSAGSPQYLKPPSFLLQQLFQVLDVRVVRLMILDLVVC